jgi:DNA-binding transcriptional LysR family regulator
VEIRQLRYFVTVAKHLHFGRAAEELFVGQSPLSQQIMRLERDLGIKLFDRTSRRVALTPEGSRLLEDASRVLAEADHLERTAASLNVGTAGNLRIGFAFSVLTWGFARHLRRFHDQRRDVNLDVTQMSVAAQEEALADNTIDIGMALGEVNARHIMVTQLGREQLVAVLPEDHRLAGQSAIDLRDLADDDFIGFSTSQIHDYITRACVRAGFAPRLSLQGPQVHTMIHLVAAGLGVTLAPRCDSAVHVDGVVYLPLDPPAEDVEINALQHRWRRNAVAARLVDDIVRASGQPAARTSGRALRGEGLVPGLREGQGDESRADRPNDTERDGKPEITAGGLGD